jgi:hypothetical protein
MNSKMILFFIILIALLAFQAKVIMPILFDIASSDIFLEDSGDEANRLSTNTTMTDTAYNQCNFYIANDLLPEHTFTFPKQPLNAFSLGNYSYVINADFDIIPNDAASFTRRYVCRIKYLNEDDNTGISDFENWSIDGLSGLDNI